MSAIRPIRQPGSRFRDWLRPRLYCSLWAFFFLCFFGLARAEIKSAIEQSPVLIVIPDKSRVYTEFLDGFSVCHQAENSSVPSYDVIQLHQLGDHPEQFDSRNVIAVGVLATQYMLGRPATTSFISALIPRTAMQQMLSGIEGQNGLKAAFYVDQPLSRRLSLVRSLLPKAKNLSVVLGPSSRGSIEDELIREASSQGFTLEIAEVESARQLSGLLQPLLKDSDGLLVLYDPVLTAPHAIKFLLYSAYQRRVPVFGYSQGYVKAGALASVYSSARGLGCQVGQSLEQENEASSSSERSDGIKRYFPEHYFYKLNHSVARSFSVPTDNLPANHPIGGDVDESP